MNIISGLKKIFSTKSMQRSEMVSIFETAQELCYREAAFWSVANLIANAISKCEVKTLVNGEEAKEQEYYLWNFEPNQNQNSTQFLHKLVTTLLRNNECLVIENDGKLYVADSFLKTPYVFYEDIFTNIQIENLSINKTFRQSEVLFFNLSEKNMRQVSDMLYQSYSQLINSSIQNYKTSSGLKALFKYDSLPITPKERDEIGEQEWLRRYVDNYIKPFLEGDNGVMPLGNGVSLDLFAAGSTYSNSTTRDIKSVVDDIFDFTARCYGVPISILKGEGSNYENVVNQFLTFSVDPLTDLLREEVIRKRIGFDGFKKGYDFYFDTKQIKHTDILSIASSIDKLVSSGVFSINDIRRFVGEHAINEEWAKRHYITKNYGKVEDAESEGGDKQ